MIEVAPQLHPFGTWCNAHNGALCLTKACLGSCQLSTSRGSKLQTSGSSRDIASPEARARSQIAGDFPSCDQGLWSLGLCACSSEQPNGSVSDLWTLQTTVTWPSPCCR